MNAEALSALIDDRPGDGVFRVHRAIFDDPGVFDMELRHIFESGWVFLGLVSQAPAAHDFFTTRIGRVPILVMRDGDGALGGFVNSCPHRGAQIAQRQCGNARLHVCAYHSWSFDSAGKNRAVKWEKEGAYADAFRSQGHDLSRLPAFGEYRGFLFGSLTGGVALLGEHLGEAAKLLDLVADQGEDGVELVPGGVAFTYEGNWKLQLENCSDAYHFTSVHPSYVRLLDRRKTETAAQATRSVWESNRNWSEDSKGVQGGSYSFANGHVLNWGVMGVSDAMPLHEKADALAARVGEARRDWMFNMRNLTIFPNMQIGESASSQLRVIRPVSARRTEMRTWCLAPKGESANARRLRIRQYEDFFNPSGLATPDDTVAYENCQRGFAGRVEPWLQGYCRGMTASRRGGNAWSDRIAMTPARSVLADSQLCDETLFHSYYREWGAADGKGAAMIDRAAAEDFLFREALLLDRRGWDAWLALYAEDAVFWIPAWRDETAPTEDPDRELSLIYYRGRRNLEERVWRIRSGLSVASAVLPRSVHSVSNVLVEHANDTSAQVSASFAVHLNDVRASREHVFFGRYEYVLRKDEGGIVIASKKILLLNDTIPAVLDFYLV